MWRAYSFRIFTRQGNYLNTKNTINYLHSIHHAKTVTHSICIIPCSHERLGSPWRYNRYNGFKAHKVTDKTIVFFGNSITNMHEWWEAFNNPNIVNRGVNGADPPIMLEHFESVLVGQPKYS